MASWTPINGHQRQLDRNELEARQQIETQKQEAAINSEREPALSIVDGQSVRSEAITSPPVITTKETESEERPQQEASPELDELYENSWRTASYVKVPITRKEVRDRKMWSHVCLDDEQAMRLEKDMRWREELTEKWPWSDDGGETGYERLSKLVGTLNYLFENENGWVRGEKEKWEEGWVFIKEIMGQETRKRILAGEEVEIGEKARELATMVRDKPENGQYRKMAKAAQAEAAKVRKANVKRQTPGLDGDAEEDSKPKAKRIRKGKAPAKPRGPVKPSSAAKPKDSKADVNARRRTQAADQDAKDAEDLLKEKRSEAMEKVAEMLKENPIRVFTSDRTEFADALGTGSKGIAQLKDEYKQLRQEDRQTTGIMKDWDKKSSSSEESDADEVPTPTKPGSSKTSIPVIDFTHFPDPIMEDWTVILAEVQAIFQAKGKRKRQELHEMWPAYFNKTRGYLLRSYWDNLFLLTDSKGNRLLPMEVCKWMNNDKTGYERWEEQHIDEFTANSKAIPRSRAKPLLKTATDPGKGTVISKEVRKVPLTKPGQFSGCSETYTGDQGLIDPYDLELACQYARLIISAHGWRTIACALITNTLGKVLRGDIKPENDSKTRTRKQRAFVDKGIAILVFEQAAFQDHKEHFAKRVKAELKKSIAKSDEFLKAQWDFKVQKLERENSAMRKLLNIAEDGDIPGMISITPDATEKAEEEIKGGVQSDEQNAVNVPTVKKIRPDPAVVTDTRTSKGAVPPSAAEILYETNVQDPGVAAIQRTEIAMRGDIEREKTRMEAGNRSLPIANRIDEKEKEEQQLLQTFHELIHEDSYVESSNTKAMKEWAANNAQQNDIDAEDAEAILDMVGETEETKTEYAEQEGKSHRKGGHETETECLVVDISTTKLEG
ncbi:hypothetical protein Vi05172_g10858 [Venturia inaequalis]|nr:hypothetical protein Vi05172_g10858 [Venturia inaequalis]